MTLLDKTKVLFTYYFRLVGLYILFGLGVAVIKQLFPELEWGKYTQEELVKILTDNKLKAFISIVIMAPLIEELMFRSLIHPTKRELLLFFSSWTLFIVSIFFPAQIVWYYKYLLAVILLSCVFLGYKLIFRRSFLLKLQGYLGKHQILVHQITSLIFGLIHIFNYVDSLVLNSVLLLLITPRIIAGHMFGKIKITNNHMIWPMLLHALNNGVVFALLSARY